SQKNTANDSSGSAKGFEQADFSCTLTDCYQHHIHYQDTGNGKADHGDSRNAQCQCAQDTIESSQYGILGDDGYIIFAIMTLNERFAHCLLGTFDFTVMPGFNQHPEQGSSVERHLGMLYRNDDHFIRIESHCLTLCSKYTGYQKTSVSQPDTLSHGTSLREEFPGNFCTQYDLRAVSTCVRQKITLRKLHMTDRKNLSST